MTKSQLLLNDIAEELNSCETREEKLETLIFYGKNLTGLSDDLKNDESRVQGCNSDTFMICEKANDGSLHFKGDSSSLIVKGYIYIFMNAFGGILPSEAQNIRRESEEFVKNAHID